MFAKLIFVASAIVGLFVVDNFSTSLALVTCWLIVYCYVYKHNFDKYLFIVHVIAKIWGCLYYCFCLGRQIYSFFKAIFYPKTSPYYISCQTLNANHCGSVINLEHEINSVVSNISRHYIRSWYDKISDNEEFLTYLNSAVKETIVSLCASVSKIDCKKFSYVVLQIYLHYFAHFLDSKKKSEEFKVENFKMKHWAMKDNMTEWCYLHSLVSCLLDSCGPAEYHNKYSPLLHTVIVEILTEHIIHPLLNMLSDPSYLNSWLLKLLISYVRKHEQISDILPTSIYSSEKPLSSDESQVIRPSILLSSDDSVIHYTSEEYPTVVSETMLSVPDSTNDIVNSDEIQKQSEEIPIEKLKDRSRSDDLPSFISSGIKSSSNINLLDSHFSGSTTVSSENSTPVSYDISTIKRSRSADYIRQMPQLRALNVKDYNIVLQSNSNKMLVALKQDASSSNYVEQAEEAVEVEAPTLFSDVKITDTLQQSEAGFLPYTLYCIQYSGIFHDTAKASETPHFVKQVVSIKRRFREFLALQSRLEDNPSLKNCLKGIKGPSKWLALPFSNLDKKNIAERKSFLEGYLKELCGQGPIAQSSELQEFLAYGGDARIAFVKKNPDVAVPRIDKMLYRGVKGAIDMFKTALPNSPVEGGCSGETSVSSLKPTFEDLSPDHRFQEHLLEFSNREPEIKESINRYINSFSERRSYETAYENWKSSTFNVKRNSLLRHIYNLNPEECCRCPGTWDASGDILYQEEYPFGNTFIELFTETLKANKLNIGHHVSVIKQLFAPCIDSYFVNVIDGISEEHLSIFLHKLHTILWPDEKSKEEKKTIENSAILQKILECLEILLEKNSITMKMRCIRKLLLEKIYLFLLSIQNKQSNRCFLFHVFDVIVETICSKES